MPHRMTPRRTLEQWANMDPKAVVAGSAAQVLHCITDARTDILLLWSIIAEMDHENTALRTRLSGPGNPDSLRAECDKFRFGKATVTTGPLSDIFGR